MGKFNFNYPANNTSSPYTDPRLYDRVLGEYQGNSTNSQTHKDYGTPAYVAGTDKFYIAISPIRVGRSTSRRSLPAAFRPARSCRR